MRMFFTRVVAFCILLCLQLGGFSQTKEIDSLRFLLRNSRQDSARVKNLIKLSVNLRDLNLMKEVIPLCKEALEISIKLQYYAGAANALNKLGIAYDFFGDYKAEDLCLSQEFEYLSKAHDLRGMAGNLHNRANNCSEKGQHDKALELYNKALKINTETGNRKWEAYNLSGMAGICEAQGDYAKALDIYFKSLKILESVKDENAFSSVCGSIGDVYRALNNFRKAHEYYMKQLHAGEKIKNNYIVISAYGGLFNLYNSVDSLDKAEECVLKTVKAAEEMGSADLISTTYFNLGSLNKDRKEYEKAIYNFKKSLELAQGDLDKIMINCGNIASTLYDQKKFPEALPYALKCLNYAKQLNAKETLLEVNGLVSAIYTGLQKDLLAFQYYKDYVKLRDSIFNNENSKKIMQAEVNFEYEKKSALDKAEQDKKDALAAEELKQQKLQRNYFIAGFSIVLVLAIFIFRGYRQKRKINVLIREQKKLVEQQKHMIEEKQKEVLDSIKYAQRIQRALITNEKYISKTLQKLRTHS